MGFQVQIYAAEALKGAQWSHLKPDVSLMSNTAFLLLQWTDRVRHHPHQPGALISFHALEKHCTDQLTVTSPVSFQIQSTSSIWYGFLVFCGISVGLSWPHLRALLTHSYSCAHICLSPSVMGVNPITDPALASEKKCDWLASRSDICSSAAKVIVSADPHVQWGRKKKAYFPSPDMKW